jgi:hypothetical protein
VAAVRGYDLLVPHGVAEQAVEPLPAATGIAESAATWLTRTPASVPALIAGAGVRYAVVDADPRERDALGLPDAARR